MEGIGGVAAYSQVMMHGPNYERARFCVDDSHGNMYNLYADELDPRAELLVGTAKPWSMGQGIDGGYDTCFFIGYHGMAGHPRAVVDHTYAGRAIYECRLNGKERVVRRARSCRRASR